MPALGEALAKLGVPLVTSKGVIGAVVDAVGGPFGLGKFAFDGLVYAASFAYYETRN